MLNFYVLTAHFSAFRRPQSGRPTSPDPAGPRGPPARPPRRAWVRAPRGPPAHPPAPRDPWVSVPRGPRVSPPRSPPRSAPQCTGDGSADVGFRDAVCVRAQLHRIIVNGHLVNSELMKLGLSPTLFSCCIYSVYLWMCLCVFSFWDW